jgi:hypothetical protein
MFRNIDRDLQRLATKQQLRFKRVRPVEKAIEAMERAGIEKFADVIQPRKTK